jgi:hypothetical protein
MIEQYSAEQLEQQKQLMSNRNFIEEEQDYEKYNHKNNKISSRSSRLVSGLMRSFIEQLIGDKK